MNMSQKKKTLHERFKNVLATFAFLCIRRSNEKAPSYTIMTIITTIITHSHFTGISESPTGPGRTNNNSTLKDPPGFKSEC